MTDTTLIDTAIAVMDDPNARPTAIADSIATIAAQRPALRIDITYPPTPAVAIVGDLEATGATADDAMRALGDAVSTATKTEQQTQAAVAAAPAIAEVTP